MNDPPPSDAADDARPYVIQPCDTVLTVALMHEVEVQALLEHPKNAPLFEERERDPHMLAPGEILYVPLPEPPTPTVAPQAVNRFVARVPWVHLHLHFESESGPLANEPFVVEGPAELLDRRRPNPKEPLVGTLDAAGNLSLRVPALTPRLLLEFPDRQIAHDILVGALDPIDRRTGLGARLLHLGYLPRDQETLDPYVFETETSERETLESFQRAFALEPSGYADPPTKKTLTDEHGS